MSNEGADGFGVSLYAVTPTAPSIEPIVVSSTSDKGPSDGDQLQFGWVDVATNASSAGCTTGDAGPLFELYGTEKLTPAQVLTTSMILQGATATVTSMSTDTMPLDQGADAGRGDLCGAPCSGRPRVSGRSPGRTSVSRPTSATSLGCGPTSRATAQEDTVGVGTTATEDPRNARPTPSIEGSPRSIRTGDGLADGRGRRSRSRTASAAARSRRSAQRRRESERAHDAPAEEWTPQYGIYEAALAGSGRENGLFPAHISSGSGRIAPKGIRFTFLAGGDEGFSGAVKMRRVPGSPGVDRFGPRATTWMGGPGRRATW